MPFIRLWWRRRYRSEALDNPEPLHIFKTKMTPTLSIIIPAYNEADHLESTLQSIFNWIKLPDWELIVVNDGSTDQTPTIVKKLSRRHPRVKLLNLPHNHGKGWAVKHGVLKSSGEWILFMDADSSTRINEMEKLWAFRDKYDVIIGSRHLRRDSIKKPQPWFRHLAGRLGNLFIRIMLLPGIYDTQCGFKLFNKKAARDLFSRQQLNGWSFDLEILVLARRLGYAIKEVPIDWSHYASGRINIFTDGLKIIFDIVWLKFNQTIF
jgi:dolichyl-phosphate beta-glucosyltransferase